MLATEPAGADARCAREPVAGIVPVPAVGAPIASAGAAAGVAGAPVAFAGAEAVLSLVSRARTGDRSAFAQLVERRVDWAFRTARAILGNEADALDATQETFLRAWRERGSLRDPARFDAWLGRILVNSCRQAMRGRRRRAVREIAASDLATEALDDPLAIAPAHGRAPDERAVSLDAIERAFDRLAVDERAILVLHHLEHRPLADVAAILCVPVGTLKSRLFAARRSLERALEAELR